MSLKSFTLFGCFVFAIFIGFVYPADAEEIRVPWPIWLLIEAWNYGAVALWFFLAVVIFVPLKQLILGVVVTIGGAFLPDFPASKSSAISSPRSDTGSVTVGHVNFKGAPRYAVLLVGIVIVLSAVWEGYKVSS